MINRLMRRGVEWLRAVGVFIGRYYSGYTSCDSSCTMGLYELQISTSLEIEFLQTNTRSIRSKANRK